MKILVCGFDLWGSISRNPSWEMIKNLPTSVSGHTLRLAKVPVVYSRIKAYISNEIDIFQPDIIVSFGLSTNVRRPRVETYGWNKGSSGRDADGVALNGLLDRDGGARVGYKTTHDISYVSEWQSSSDPYKAYGSDDAGDFLCNALVYYTMQHLDENNLSKPFLFSHVPSEQSMPIEAQKTYGKLIIQKMVEEQNDQLDWDRVGEVPGSSSNEESTDSPESNETEDNPTEDNSTEEQSREEEKTWKWDVIKNILTNASHSDYTVKSDFAYEHQRIGDRSSYKYAFQAVFINKSSESFDIRIKLYKVSGSDSMQYVTLKPGENHVEVMWDLTKPNAYFQWGQDRIFISAERRWNDTTIKGGTAKFGRISG